MFFFNGKYISTIVVNGVDKIISRIGENRVFYHCFTRRIEQIGIDRVVYDNKRECITKIGALDVQYDVKTGRMSSIGTIPVHYDEQTGCIVSIGNATVFYATAPAQYEPVEGSYYSPIKTGPDAQEPSDVCQPIGFSFESANRERMAGFITDLSNEAVRETALFKIGHNIEEERKASEAHDHFSDGYCSVAIELGAIKKIMALLTETSPKCRRKAQEALLTFSQAVLDVHQPEFLRQITNEASYIIDAMTTVMFTPIQNLNENLEPEVKNALALFNLLPFAHNTIQSLIVEKKIIPFLIKKKRDSISFQDDIGQILGKIKIINLKYKNMILRAETLTQSPLPFNASQLETAYLSYSFFSKQKGIFQDVGSDQNKLDTLLESLQTRAEMNPGGASEKTLNHFKVC